MKTKCCLIAVGGCGYRLKKDGITFPYSKSSLEVSGKVMLYWLLDVLEESGIRRIVMTSERKDSLDFVRRLVNDNFSNRFDEVSYNLDFGFGSSGLPFQSKDLLDYPCFFEAGHSFQKPEHYRKMDEIYEQGCLIASGFPPKNYAPRYTIRKEKEKIMYVGKKLASFGDIEVGSPKLFGEDFVNILPKLDYDFNKIFPHYIKDNKLKVISSDMPLEVDVKMEWEEAIPLYKKFILEKGLK